MIYKGRVHLAHLTYQLKTNKGTKKWPKFKIIPLVNTATFVPLTTKK